MKTTVDFHHLSGDSKSIHLKPSTDPLIQVKTSQDDVC